MQVYKAVGHIAVGLQDVEGTPYTQTPHPITAGAPFFVFVDFTIKTILNVISSNCI